MPSALPGSAFCIIGEELRRLNRQEQDLLTRRKSDPVKLALGARLRGETTLSINAIAQRVHLGTSKSANIRPHATVARAATAPTLRPTLGLSKGDEPC